MKKWERASYIAHTVAKARDSWEKYKEKTGDQCQLPSEDLSQKKIDTDQQPQILSNAIPQPGTGKDVEEESRFFFGFCINWPIVSLTKYEQEDTTTYIMRVIEKGAYKDIRFKTINQLIERPLFEVRFMEVMNQKPQKTSKANWDRIVASLHLFMKTEKVSDESTTRGRMAAWIKSYLDNSAKLSVEHAAPNKDPFIKSGHWYIFSAPFKRWALHECSFTEGVGRLHLDLKLCGIVEKSVNYMKRNTKTMTACKAWQIPKNIIDPDGGQDEKEVKEKTQVLQLVQTPQDGRGDSMETERVEQIKVG
jgi:hypothetical protein